MITLIFLAWLLKWSITALALCTAAILMLRAYLLAFTT